MSILFHLNRMHIQSNFEKRDSLKREKAYKREVFCAFSFVSETEYMERFGMLSSTRELYHVFFSSRLTKFDCNTVNFYKACHGNPPAKCRGRENQAGKRSHSLYPQISPHSSEYKSFNPACKLQGKGDIKRVMVSNFSIPRCRHTFKKTRIRKDAEEVGKLFTASEEHGGENKPILASRFSKINGVDPDSRF
jgi:hypothetical protein